MIVMTREELFSTLTSLSVHLILLVVMALIILPLPLRDPSEEIVVRTTVAPDPELEAVEQLDVVPEEIKDPAAHDAAAALALPTETVAEQPSSVRVDVSQRSLVAAVAAEEFLARADLTDLAGRSEESRGVLLRAFGGSEESEIAVSSGLKWLAMHQRPNGSWNFDHRGDACGAECADAGTLTEATVAATSMALLCYLGAGHTHQKGTYQPQVSRGLKFLLKAYQQAEIAGDLRQIAGNSGMYAQGLATITLCEAYGMTKDESLLEPAQRAVRFIEEAQHPTNGGWRYKLRDETGDTSVVGWQIMALTSAEMADLKVRKLILTKASRYLDSVSLGNGAYYGYTQPQKKASTTAIGLLSRMYLGWNEKRPALKEGVEYLAQIGPSPDNMYHNYYATQVLHHWGGAPWTRWNAVMRDRLVSTQDKEGHAAGSWAPRDPHGRHGGRHYMTCLAILTLEVYYRHLPLYQRPVVENLP